jgi:hypothetical protein
MKRSQALIRIIKILENYDSSEEDYAEQILGMLEDAGMSPPPDITVGMIDGMIACQWEDEDGF